MIWRGKRRSNESQPYPDRQTQQDNCTLSVTMLLDFVTAPLVVVTVVVVTVVVVVLVLCVATLPSGCCEITLQLEGVKKQNDIARSTQEKKQIYLVITSTKRIITTQDTPQATGKP